MPQSLQSEFKIKSRKSRKFEKEKERYSFVLKVSDVSQTEKPTELTDNFPNRTGGLKKNQTKTQTDRPKSQNFQHFTGKIVIP